ncbi:DDE family transposase [Sanguibacter antarcticus]|uniref:DDE family transposase n=1 Tax=Sanguibacter antarcticus TaxID=372484 RepID=A0A2A9E4M6_9MICO|nr:DDE family transposase [Sanguibacter antarcticus]
MKSPLVVDLDATLVTAHSEKESAAPTFKRGFGFHPLCSFLDHGGEGTGEPLAIGLRPGNAGSNTAADHIAEAQDALAQLPGHSGRRRGTKKILVRTDGAGGTKALIEHLTAGRLAYSIGFTLPENTPDLLALIPPKVWAPALDAHDEIRDGAGVAELTALMDLTGWPKGMRVIVRKELPHPGAQLRFDDVDAMPITAFVTNTRTGQLPDLELRHRRRARCEDRIRIAKAPPRASLQARGSPQPDCGTGHSKPSPRTRSGAPSSHWPATCWLGWECSPSLATRPAAGTPRDCGCVCSRSPRFWREPAGEPGCAWPTERPGRPWQHEQSPLSEFGPRPPDHQQGPCLNDSRTTTRPWNRRPPRR